MHSQAVASEKLLIADPSQRMQVDQQIINLLLRQRSTEVGHVFTAGTDDFTHALVVRGEARHGKKLLPKYTFQSRTFFPLRRIGFVATSALIVKDVAPGSLLRRQPQLGVRLAPLVARRRQEGRSDYQQQ